MLKLVHRKSEKEKLQQLLESALKDSLKLSSCKFAGNRGGTDQLEIYSNGQGQLWYAHQIAPTQRDIDNGRAEKAIVRHWNAFGVYDVDAKSQAIITEINIPIEVNSGRVAGFFSVDPDLRSFYLMHSGRVGGGRPGIGKKAFLDHSGYKVEAVRNENSDSREGIRICEMERDSILEAVTSFVFNVADFKNS